MDPTHAAPAIGRTHVRLGDYARAVGRGQAPHWAWVHLALVTIQVIFGTGAVIGKLGVAHFNPILFVGIRDGIGGPLLMCLSLVLNCRNTALQLGDVPRMVAAGFCLYVSQAGFIVGEKLSSAVIGSAWQPAQPVMTAVIASCLGWEPFTLLRFGGISFALAGAAFMVFFPAHGLQPGSNRTDLDSAVMADANVDEWTWLVAQHGPGQDWIDSSSSSTTTNTSHKGVGTFIAGNALFFCNCMGTSMYVILSKPMVKQYHYVTVTAWAYMFGAGFSVSTAVLVNSWKDAVDFVAPGLPFDNRWDIPSSAYWPLAYWILFNSCAAYLLITFGNKHADASNVLAYTALQPVTTAVLCWLLNFIPAMKHYNLAKPGLNSLGGVVVLAGLACIVYVRSLSFAHSLRATLTLSIACDAGYC